MEAQFAERLRVISHARKQMISKLQHAVPALHFLETNWVFHSILGFTATALIISVFRVIRSLTIFSFHPLCMILGTFIFFAEGVASYRNHSLLDAFSPIMQHNKRMKVSYSVFCMPLIVISLLSIFFIFCLVGARNSSRGTNHWCHLHILGIDVYPSS
jgi:hypothetical protein